MELKENWICEITEIPDIYQSQSKENLDAALKEVKIYFIESQEKNKRIVDNSYKVLALVNALILAEISIILGKSNNPYLMVSIGVLIFLQFFILLRYILPIITPYGSYCNGTPPEMLMTKNLITCSWAELVIAQGQDYYGRIRLEHIRNLKISTCFDKAMRMLIYAPLIALSLPVICFLYRGLSLTVEYYLRTGINLF